MAALRDTAVFLTAVFSAFCLFVIGMTGVFFAWLFAAAMATAPVWVPLIIIAGLIKWVFF